MTLSNFDGTDKASVKWFIMLPTGHEGPYSLINLEQLVKDGTISPEIKIWTEGLEQMVTLHSVLSSTFSDEIPPPLPPLPGEEDLPPLPFIDTAEEIPDAPPVEMPEIEEANSKRKIPWFAMAPLLVLFLGLFGFYQWVQGQEKFSIRRVPKMSLEVHERIEKESEFESWHKKIFFKEYVPADLSLIWLVTSSYQTCDVEAIFQSMPGKTLSVKDEEIKFSSSAKLKDHIVEFSTFNFLKGQKIIPGLYEMRVQATHCEWSGLIPKIMNSFSPPDETYEAKTRLVLYPAGAVKFQEVLDRLIKKKNAIEIKIQNNEDLFWQDVQQKLQTILAITLQMEQHFIDFLDVDHKDWKKDLNTMVEVYTRKYGHFLTNFIVANEAYFKDLEESSLKNISLKKNYEPKIRQTTKNIGLEAMRIIERFQAVKTNLTPVERKNSQKKISGVFEGLKKDLNQKIIQVSEDRSK